MKKISLFSFLAAAFLCVGQNVMAQKTLFTYTIAEGTVKNATNIQATGGVVDLNVNAVETKNNLLGAKLSSDNYYILCKLADGVTLQTGDVIELKIFQNSTSNIAITDATTYGVTVASAISGVTTFDGTVYVGISDGKGLATGSFTVGADLNGKSTFYVRRNSTKSMYCQAITISRPVATQDDATLKAIKIGDAELEGFDAATTEYNVELLYGTTTAPEVSATATSEHASVAITQATSATGTATITVTAENETTTKTYTINFTVAASASTDATLKSLSIDGNAVAGFRADSLDYKYEIAYTAALPVISAEVNDIAATMEITQVIETPGTATVVVTAQDGTTTTTYTVAISRAAAIKHLTVVPFSNGAKGAIDESALTVTVPYLAGTDEPTIDATGITVSGDGASAALSEDGKTITLTGADGVSTAYTVVLQPLAVNSELGTDLITFDGTETYIFGVYGFEAEGTDSKGNTVYKGWKFAKNVDEEGNMRNASGKTRIYMALPPAKSVDLTSGTGGARAVKIYVNGVEVSSVTQTAAKGDAITLTLNESQDNFIAIESNQDKGDGGFTAMQLAKTPEGPGTSFEQAEVSAKAVKVIRDGQLYILRDGKTYNTQGIVVE